MRCTPEHPFLTADGEFVHARWLESGMMLHGLEGDERVVSVGPLRLDHEVPVYDLEVAGVHNFAVATSDSSGVIVHNSEYMHIDNSACNLASINLLKYLREDDSFDTESFNATVDVVFTAQEILVGNADYPPRRSPRTRAGTGSSGWGSPTWVRCSWRRACPTTLTRVAPGLHRSRPS